MMCDTLAILAQTTPVDPYLPTKGIVLAALATLVIIVVLVASDRRLQKTEVTLSGLIKSGRFHAIRGGDALEKVAREVMDFFGELSMYARIINVPGAITTTRGELEVQVVHTVLGMERSNANHHTLDKVVVFIRGFDVDLPRFKRMPNNYLFRQIHRDQLYRANAGFGRNNLVMGPDKAFIHHVLGGDMREQLMDDRSLVIESKGDTLAFYTHDDRCQPDDLPAFIDRCTQLAGLIASRTRTYEPTRALQVA